MENYTVHYELSVNGKVIEDDMIVEAVSEERAVEFCGQVLDQQYDEDAVLLTCEVAK